jgi:transcriptional regulator with XRE-family HTH domain
MQLRTARRRRKWSQEDLEARSKVEQSTISRMERGVVVRPSLKVVLALAAALEVNPGDLEFGQNKWRTKLLPRSRGGANGAGAGR